MRIGVLTSGGDAPGMNATIRAVVRAAIQSGDTIFGIYDGYRGLVEGKMTEFTRKDVSEIISRGGTILGTARLPEFKYETVRQLAIKQLERNDIEALITIGGDGTYTGALKLHKMGIKTIGIPGTIDNDIASTDYTIGFSTALNTACEAIDKLRDTSSSHQRCSVVEVMGRYCGDLAVYSALATGADIVITRENPMSEEDLYNEIKNQVHMGKHHIMVIITEKIYNVSEIADKITKNCGIEAKSEVLGRIQRGGTPAAFDRYLASVMGVHAIDLLLNGESGLCVGLIDNKLTATPIEEALKMQNKSNKFIKRMLCRTR